jgi:acetyl-CoA carboxylase biotin carboxyl carrier protein
MESTREQSIADTPSEAMLAQLPDVVRELCQILDKNELLELEVNYGAFRVRLSRALEAPPGGAVSLAPLVSTATPAAVAPSSVDNRRTTTIKSPLAGIFYRAPSPGAPPFVSIGEDVGMGQTVCIIEAMKLMNEIGSEVRGRIRSIMVENAAVVESGQDLMVVEEF